MSNVVSPITMGAKEDLTTRCVIVNFDEDVPVPAEEVIHFLESEELNKRTRTQVSYTIEKMCEKGCAFCVHFKCALDWFFRLDILDALQNFFSRRGFVTCIV